MILNRIICFAIGYAFGCISIAYFYAKSKGIDIKSEGSGNAGATNTLRVLGKKSGALVFAGDILKAVLACLISALLFGGTPLYTGASQIWMLYAAIGAVVGHCFPFYLSFSGGKGVSSLFGALLIVDWRLALGCFCFFIIIVALTKLVSLGSILAAVLYLIVWTVIGIAGGLWIGPEYFAESCVILFVIVVIVAIRHRGNIKRLLSGTENRLNLK